MPITVEKLIPEPSERAPWKVETAGSWTESRTESWTESLVTILAVVAFGLGWGLVETLGWALVDGGGRARVESEHAGSLENRYDPIAPETRSETARTSIESRSAGSVDPDLRAHPHLPTATLAAISSGEPGARTRGWTAPDLQDSRP